MRRRRRAFGASLVAAGLTLYLRVIGRTMVARGCFPMGQGKGDGGAGLDGSELPGRVLAIFWSADQVLLSAFAYARCERADPRAFLERFRFVADDTFAGEVMADFLARRGLTSFRLTRSSAEQRLADLRRLVREETGPVAIAVDGGGPYFRVSRAIVALADSMGAKLIPLGVRATRTWRVGRRIRLRFPLPGSRMELVVGRLVDPRAERSAKRAAEALAADLAVIAGT